MSDAKLQTEEFSLDGLLSLLRKHRVRAFDGFGVSLEFDSGAFAVDSPTKPTERPKQHNPFFADTE